SYNHSEEYVESVLLRAKLISTYPKSVIATLTGLVDGRLPVTGTSVSWEGPPGAQSDAAANPGASSSEPSSGSTGTSGSSGSPGATGSSGPTGATGFVDVRSTPNSSVVAVQDGRVLKIGASRQLGKYVVLRDVNGDVFTYAGLGAIAGSYSPPKTQNSVAHSAAVVAASTHSPAPSQPATAGVQSPLTLNGKKPVRKQPG